MTALESTIDARAARSRTLIAFPMLIDFGRLNQKADEGPNACRARRERLLGRRDGRRQPSVNARSIATQRAFAPRIDPFASIRPSATMHGWMSSCAQGQHRGATVAGVRGTCICVKARAP